MPSSHRLHRVRFKLAIPFPPSFRQHLGAVINECDAWGGTALPLYCEGCERYFGVCYNPFNPPSKQPCARHDVYIDHEVQIKSIEYHEGPRYYAWVPVLEIRHEVIEPGNWDLCRVASPNSFWTRGNTFSLGSLMWVYGFCGCPWKLHLSTMVLLFSPSSV